MGKRTDPKIFKLKKKCLDEQDGFWIRYKNLDKKLVKELKADLDRFTQAYLKNQEPEE